MRSKTEVLPGKKKREGGDGENFVVLYCIALYLSFIVGEIPGIM